MQSQKTEAAQPCLDGVCPAGEQLLVHFQLSSRILNMIFPWQSFLVWQGTWENLTTLFRFLNN